jgi:hypothetical protein
MNKYLNLILLALVLFSCENRASSAFSIPPDAIPFEYSEEKQKAILFNGMMNDTVPLKILFDTGNFNNGIEVSDSLQGILMESDNWLQIGTAKRLININFHDKNNQFFQYYGANMACIGRNFFHNKIIEISYQHKYIRELEHIPQSTEYRCVKIDSAKLTIPVEILIQGNWIKNNVLLDTGYNGLLDLNADIIGDYSINMDSAQSVTSINVLGKRQGWFVPFDSISVGGCSIPGFCPVEISNRAMGIIGNTFLDNFDIILDLKDYNLYLKPIEKE